MADLRTAAPGSCVAESSVTAGTGGTAARLMRNAALSASAPLSMRHLSTRRRHGPGELERIALRCGAWSERWIPDAYVFAALAVVIVAVAALARRTPRDRESFGDGYWSLIPFTMQMASSSSAAMWSRARRRRRG